MSLTDAVEKKKKPAAASAPRRATTPANDKRTTPYAAAALERECRAVAEAPQGTRNDTLNRAAFNLGGLIGAGALDEGDVVRALEGAARWEAPGCSAGDAKKIADGIAAGRAEPREIPPPNVRHAAHDEPPPGRFDDDAEDVPPGDWSKGDVFGRDDAAQPGPLGGFSLIDPAAIWAELEEPVYVVDGVIRRGTLTEIVSYGGSGKSWLAVDLVVSVAAGVRWLGRFPTTTGRTTYLDWENGSYEMRRRFQAAAQGRGLTGPVEGVDLCTMPNAYLSDATFPGRLAALAKERDLIVIDTLKAADPLTDENDSKIRVGLDAMRRTAELTGCAFVVLVHSKKTSGSATAIDPREAGRGSSAIYDAADAVLHIQYTEGKPLRVQQTKSRLGRSVPPFLVTIEDVDGGVRVAAEDVPAAETGDDAAKFDAICTEVLDAVKAYPGTSKRLLTEKLHKRFNTIAAALENLQRNGAVSPTGTGKTERWFAVVRGGSNDG